MSETVLLVDPDVEVLRILGAYLEQQGMEVARELDAETAVEAVRRLDPDAAAVDFAMLDGDGNALRDTLAQQGVPFMAVLDDDADEAVASQALRAGAERVLVRPLDPERLQLELTRICEARHRRRLANLSANQASTAVRLQRLGSSAPMRDVARDLASVAESDRTSVLIVGEPGVGKAWAARLIHHTGPRAAAPLLECTTAGMDASRFEVQLVGAERWARAGVDGRTRGLMELAGQGSLLIRGIGGLPRELQPALLRSLEGHTFRRVGGDRDLVAQARLIVTSSVDLAKEVEADRFSGDLFYRLSALVIQIPPVRERSRTDRIALIQSLHDEVPPPASAIPPALSPEALERLVEYPWPGNVREIQLVLVRASFMALGQPAVLVEHLPAELRARPGLGDRRHNSVSLEEVERRQIESALRYHGGNRTRAAKELRISRATLINKIKRYALS
jgi:DNA-binding NtrC family response regulator